MLTAELLSRQRQLNSALYDEAYAFWKAEWITAFSEQGLTGITASNSDKFVNADELLIFREGSEIVALALINHIDLSLSAYRDIAYLQTLPHDAWELLRERGVKKILTSGYNVVKKEYRRAMVGSTLISIALPGYVIALFEERTEFDLCMGMPLVAMGNHKILSRLGMRDMHRGLLNVHDVDAKFMYLTRDIVDLGKYRPDIKALFPSHRAKRKESHPTYMLEEASQL